jgi:hypothetical protein
VVEHICNPSYMGGRSRRTSNLNPRSTQEKV